MPSRETVEFDWDSPLNRLENTGLQALRTKLCALTWTLSSQTNVTSANWRDDRRCFILSFRWSLKVCQIRSVLLFAILKDPLLNFLDVLRGSDKNIQNKNERLSQKLQYIFICVPPLVSWYVPWRSPPRRSPGRCSTRPRPGSAAWTSPWPPRPSAAQRHRNWENIVRKQWKPGIFWNLSAPMKSFLEVLSQSQISINTRLSLSSCLRSLESEPCLISRQSNSRD